MIFRLYLPLRQRQADRLPVPSRMFLPSLYIDIGHRLPALDRTLLNQLHSHLRSLEDLLSRLRFNLTELQCESGLRIGAKKEQAKKKAVEKNANPGGRRTTLLRRATLSLLESARRGSRR